MKYPFSQNKASRQTEITSQPIASAGQEATSVAPPEYGIDFVDHQTASATPVQSSSFAPPESGVDLVDRGLAAAPTPLHSSTVPERSPGDERYGGSNEMAIRSRDGNQGVADVQVQALQAVRETAKYGTSGSGGPLPYLSEIQRSFGRHDVRHIRAYQDSRAAAAARAIGARAYTTGDRVAFAGLPDLHTAAHEATHAVQQRAGVHLTGGVGKAGDRYERHADAVADQVVSGRSAHALLDQMAPAGSRVLGVQRQAVQQSSGSVGGDSVVQRQGKNLQSPWLKGDATLEDVLDGKKELKNPRSGTAVRRVQQLLFILGYDLGKHGADGVFKGDTEAAVKKFQQDFKSSGLTDYGRIEMNTIAVLDSQAELIQVTGRRTPGAPPPSPSVSKVPALAVSKIDVVDSARGALTSYGRIVGGASLNTPGPFNSASEVKNSHQIHFTLDHGDSADLTPVREIKRTSKWRGGSDKNPADEKLPAGAAGPVRQGGFTGSLIGRDGPGAHEIKRPTKKKIVVADAPGLSGLAAHYPVSYMSHFFLRVQDTSGAPIADIAYDVGIRKTSAVNVPNAENAVSPKKKRDLVRGKNL